MFKVSHNFGCDHFLGYDEAVLFAERQSELLCGKFTVWFDDGQGELVDCAYEDGVCVRSTGNFAASWESVS